MADGTVVLNQTFLAQDVQNVLVFSNIPEDAQGRQTFADSLRAAWASNWSTGDHSTLWSLDSLTFVYNDSLPIFSVPQTFTAGPIIGADPNEALPAQVSLLVSTQRLGVPPNRGRIYFGGFCIDHLTTSGNFVTALRDNAASFIQSLVDGVDYDGGAGTAFLRIGRRSPQGDLTASSPIDNVIARVIPATQRRRRVGVGI